jgi:hypothetical protein
VSRKLLQPWWALAALVLAVLIAPYPAQAQDPPGPLPPRPYGTMGAYVSSPPNEFCSEEERQAYLAGAEKARKVIEADADLARAYFIALRQHLGAYQAAGNRDAVGVIMGYLREFEHGEEDATQGNGPLHYMTVERPAEVEAYIAKARAAPLIDCSMEALEKMRPQLDRIQLPDLPARLCSEAEREALRQRLRAAAAAAREQIARLRDHRDIVEGHGGMLDPDPGSSDHELHMANIAVERSWVSDMTLHNSKVGYWAGEREKALDAMPIVPCEGAREAIAEPGGRSPFATPVPPRPPLPAGSGPIPATPLCTEADRAARLAQFDAAIRAADTRLGMAGGHLAVLQQIQAVLKQGNANEFAIYDIDREVRAYTDVVRALRLADERLRVQRAETASRPLDPCATPAPAPAVAVPGTPPSRFAVPARPELPPEPAPVPNRLICTDLDRRSQIELLDAAIRAADLRLSAANAHMLALGKLSGEAATGDGSFSEVEAINAEARRYQELVHALKRAADAARIPRREAATRPLDPCPPSEQPAEAVTTPPTGEKPGPAPRPGGKKACLPGGKRPGRAPISIGSNGKVGSGARAKKKVLSTLGGLAGGLLGGGGGGGGGTGGPQLAKCRIKNSEKTVFTDPGTGISLRVGAKRTGDTVVVFADVAKSPDSGTFQGGWVETPDGGTFGPHRADICELWGEWSLTVSWTKTTYVDGQVVKRESGGYSKAGRFDLPGMVSTDAAPSGLWQRLGFSNASHGARSVALQYRIPAVELAAAPMRLLIHVTRPSRNPVDTQPFELVMTEGPGGIAFGQAPAEEPCEPDTDAVPAGEGDTDQRRLPSRTGHKLEFEDSKAPPVEVDLKDGKKLVVDGPGAEVEDKPAPAPPNPEDRAAFSPDRRATRLGRRGSARRSPS